MSFEVSGSTVVYDLFDGTEIQGGNGKQDTVGTFGADIIDGGNGKDTISGAGGDDKILGGNSADVIEGGFLNDRCGCVSQFEISALAGRIVASKVTLGRTIVAQKMRIKCGQSFVEVAAAQANAKVVLRNRTKI